MNSGTEKPIIKGLGADAPDPELKEKLMLFGQFVGDWEIESQWFLSNGLIPTGKGEIHFGWILNGTAIQDVWSGYVENPPPGLPSTGFGTTIRFYDPKLDALRIIWIDPANSIMQTFVARPVGDEIVLEGMTIDGKYPERWILSEITPNPSIGNQSSPTMMENHGRLHKKSLLGEQSRLNEAQSQ